MITNKKLLKIVTIISTIALLVFLIILIRHIVIYSKYPSVSAEIIDVINISGVGGNSRARITKVTYKYNVDNEEYIQTKQAFYKSRYNIGKKEIIRYNPDNPSQIENTYFYNGTKIVIVFLLVFNILAYYLFFKNKKS